MGLSTVNPTSNTTPDAGQGGSAVTGAGNTGHSSTQSLQSGVGTTTKTCLWTGFPSVSGSITAVTLLVDWAQNGTSTDSFSLTSNQLTIDYSLNGGGAWSSLRNVSQVGTSSSGTSQVSLSTSQDLTQVRVRDALIASGAVGEAASITVTISNIRLEVVTAGGGQQTAVMM